MRKKKATKIVLVEVVLTSVMNIQWHFRQQIPQTTMKKDLFSKMSKMKPKTSLKMNQTSSNNNKFKQSVKKTFKR